MSTLDQLEDVLMARKPRYEELEKKVKELEREVSGHKWIKEERRHSEKLESVQDALTETKEAYRRFFNTTSDAIMIFDAETKQFIDVNDAALHLYGYSKEEFLSLRQPDITDDPEKSDESIKQTLAGEITRIPLRYHKKKDGRIFPVEISAGVFDFGSRRVMCGVIRDITERMHAEEALRQSEERYRTILDSIGEGYFEVDLAGKFTFFNDWFCKITDGCRKDLIGVENRDYMTPESAKEIYRVFNQIYKTGIPAKNVDYEIITKKGDNRVHELSASLMRDQTGQPIGFRGIVRDITELKKTEYLKSEIAYLRHEQGIVYDFDQIIAESPAMKKLIKSLKSFSETDSTILMSGETGTGKSFLSGSIHFNSHRRNKPFVKINCSNIPETLLESELFGHEKGAFTGADKLRIGRFEQANRGTIFLDEIGELNLSLQGKLLRVLEEKEFERVGGSKTIHSDVRVIAATNRNLEDEIASGNFREDLYYRINVLTIHIPPLRERRECIEPLAQFFLNKISRALRKGITGFSPPVIESFMSYSWPGNIRQLVNTIERAVIIQEGHIIQKSSVAFPESTDKAQVQKTDKASRFIKKNEEGLILNALEESLWIQKDAAKILGISPRALNYAIKRLGITHPRWRKNR
jgi:two-component system response regulator AtoC